MTKMEGLEVKDTIEGLHKKIKALESRLRILEDTEEIKKLQRMYGY